MTTYVYETVPEHPSQKAERFEVRQSIKDAPLTRHPTTGQPVRRVISGGFGFIAQKSTPPSAPCGNHCGCFGSN
jgi:predicted nucleic acid-binding Zn ribbon protein